MYNTLGIHSDYVVPALVYLALAATLFSGFHYIRHAARLAASAPDAES
jgi:hypothetical protein